MPTPTTAALLRSQDLIENARLQTVRAYRQLADAAILCAAALEDPTATPGDRRTQERSVVERQKALKAAREYRAAIQAGASLAGQAGH